MNFLIQKEVYPIEYQDRIGAVSLNYRVVYVSSPIL